MNTYLRSFLILNLALALACGDDDGTADTGTADTGTTDTGTTDTGADDTGADDTGADDTGADDTGADDAGDMVDLTTSWIDEEMAVVEGATIEIYEVTDLATVLGTGTTDDTGTVVISIPPVATAWVAHASADGFKDTWYFHSAGATEDSERLGNSMVSLASWDLLHLAAGVTADPADGAIAAVAADTTGTPLAGAVATVDTDGTVVYRIAGVPTPAATETDDTGQALIANAPVGANEVTFTVDARVGMRTLVVFADSLTIGGVGVPDA